MQFLMAYITRVLTILLVSTVFKIVMGTLDQVGAADIEFVLKPYMNTARKRKFLSDEDPW